MAFQSKLAELFIEFVTKGVGDVTQTIQSIQQQMQGLSTVANTIGGQIASQFKTVGNLLNQVFAERLRPQIKPATSGRCSGVLQWRERLVGRTAP